MSEQRVQKLMALAGYGSRRSCEKLIAQGRVTVNNKTAILGTKADPERDDIRVDGARLSLPDERLYIMLNKPKGVISDQDVGEQYEAARELIPLDGHLYPVGRLDVRSEGLMLFTNDGDLAHKLTHPSYEHPKTYRVTLEGKPSPNTIQAWQQGVKVDGKRTLPADIEVIHRSKDKTLIDVTLREGRKRQIRRVAAELGHPVLRLVRVSLGPLELGNLPSGSWRQLTEEEIAALKRVRSSTPRRKGRKKYPQKSVEIHQGRVKRTPVDEVDPDSHIDYRFALWET